MSQPEVTAQPVATPWLVLLCAVWILAGLFGHEPWKPDEAYTFDLVYHMVQTGDWIVPTLAGEPFVEKPPLFFIVAALFAKAFSGWLPLHDGARIATAFFMAVTCAFTALAARALHGHGRGTLAALILLGCLGLVGRGHELLTDVALLCAFAMACYAFAITLEHPWLAGLLLGTGVGLGFMTKGLIAPGMLGLVALALPMAGPYWRQRNYFLCLAVSLVAMLPWLTLWPWLLYRRSPLLFHEWFFVQNWGRFFGSARLSFPNEPGFYFKILPWYGWPAWPLALWALWRGGRAALWRPDTQLPLIYLGIVMLVLTVAAEAREVYGLPLLVPLALLAPAGADALRHRAVLVLQRGWVAVLLMVAAGLWLGWLVALVGWPQSWARWIGDVVQPAPPPGLHPLELAMALAATIICLAAIALGNKDSRHAIIAWTAGIALLWALAMTLWLPLIDEAKGYKRMLTEMHAAMPADYNCVASKHLGEPQRGMLDYYFGLVTKRLENREGAECRVLLVQGYAAKGPPVLPSYNEIWEGSRPGDNFERFWLYRRDEHEDPHLSERQ